MIYLDNAATTYPKPRTVIKEVDKCIRNYCANPGRSSHQMSVKCEEKVYEARENVASLLPGILPENIIFTQNATHGLNLAIKGFIKEKCHVIISDLEHNSVIRPVYKAITHYGGRISIYNSDLPLREAIIPLISSDTKLIVSTICSNVTGKEIDYITLCSIAKEHNLKLILDGSQFIGHKIFIQPACGYDCFVAPGHKALFGLQGVGFVAFGNDKEIDTLFEGGNGLDTFNVAMPKFNPERYEAGTLCTPSIVGLSEGIKYINNVGIDNISEKIRKLTARMYNMVLSVGNTTIYGADNGILSFNVKSMPSSSLAKILSDKNIATRAGFHCAPLIHRKLGTEEQGAVRISFSYLNSEKDLDCVYRCLKSVSR